ncbi:lipopolysaccharide biosynthesis protein [Clostridium sulfidigenes]|uniref:lipopolysaccharide biosynthesis protein n=1 Tax=Clostridium sulfidigenes TaxID=318464 RepID=UPI003F891FE1
MGNEKKVILSGLIWKGLEKSGSQGVQFVIQIILARILLPEDYGVISLITIFITIGNVFIQSGFSTSLIQKKDADEVDFSSVLYLNLIVAIIVYVLLFLFAPTIAEFYNEPQLKSILRILAIILFFGAINSIQNSIISRRMQFKKSFFSSLGGSIISGIIGVTMAYAGFGVWSLVVQQITNQLLITVILWYTLKWRPKLYFSLGRLKFLFSYGWKLLCSSLLDTLYNNIYGLVIGKLYNPQMLGYYNRGDQFPQMIIMNINGSIQSVMLPAMAAKQDDKLAVKEMVRRSIVTSSFVIFPMMIGLAVCADSVVRIVLTDKWLPCVPFLQLLCLSYALWPIHTANLQAINALGRSDIFLKLEVVKKCIGITTLCISIPFGIYGMVIFKLIVAFISSIINAYPNIKLLNYSIKEQWRDVMPSLILSVIMGIIIYPITFIGWNSWITLSIQVLVGISIYIGFSFIFKLECLNYILHTIKEIRNKG